MSNNPRRRSKSSQEIPATSRTTAHAAPNLLSMVQGMSAGSALDEQVERAFARLGHKLYAPGLSQTWVGAQQLIESLTHLGHYVELQVHADRCRCRVLRVLKGNALAKQLATIDAATLPEAIAKASLLTLLGVEPPSA
jgi:hypothetical protein